MMPKIKKQSKNKKAAKMLVDVVSNGIMTGDSICRMGYEFDFTCRACGEGRDNVKHLAFTCAHVENQLLFNVKSDHIAQMLQHPVNGLSQDLAMNRLLFPKPEIRSTPTSQPIYEFINFEGADAEFTPDDGEVFVDGSCLFPSHAPLARAGTALAQVDNEGKVTKAVLVTIPKCYPQTPLFSEINGLLLAYGYCQKTDLVTDCQTIVSQCSAGVGPSLKSGGPHVCVWKNIDTRHNRPYDRINQVIKTKAHRKECDVPDDPQEIQRWKGNKAVDELAKLAAAKHSPLVDDIKLYKSAHRHVSDTARHTIARMLEVSRIVKLPKRSRQHVRMLETQLDEESDHKFVWRNKWWICTSCLRRTRCRMSVFKLNSKCPGESPIAKLLNNPNGHELYIAAIEGGGDIVYCKACYSTAETCPKLLSKQCTRTLGGRGKRTTFAPIAKDRLSKLLHPTCLRPLSRPIKIA